MPDEQSDKAPRVTAPMSHEEVFIDLQGNHYWRSLLGENGYWVGFAALALGGVGLVALNAFALFQYMVPVAILLGLLGFSAVASCVQTRHGMWKLHLSPSKKWHEGEDTHQHNRVLAKFDPEPRTRLKQLLAWREFGGHELESLLRQAALPGWYSHALSVLLGAGIAYFSKELRELFPAFLAGASIVLTVIVVAGFITNFVWDPPKKRLEKRLAFLDLAIRDLKVELSGEKGAEY